MKNSSPILMLVLALWVVPAAAQPVIRLPHPGGSDGFGRSAAVLGSNFLVATDGYDELRVGLYDGSGTLLRTYIPPIVPAGYAALAVLGSDILIGIIEHPFSGTDAPGRVFQLDGGSGALVRTISSPTSNTDTFGQAVAAVGGNVLVGQPKSDVSAVDAGVAYLFDGSTGALLHIPCSIPHRRPKTISALR